MRWQRNPPVVVRWMKRLESADVIDRLEGPPQALADLLVNSPQRRRLLHGTWLGHAAHPLLTDIPIGAWTSASVIDIAGGRESRRAAELLLTFGLIAAVPTAITGLAEWGTLRGPQRRVGLVHASINVAALSMYAASLAARRRRRHRLGVGLALAGGATASVGGYLGGHMVLARKVSSRHPAFGHPGPTPL